VALEFTDDGRDRETGELDAEAWVVPVDSVDQTDGGGLYQVVGKSTAAGVAVRELPG
jgi:hypothetical protein